MCFKKKEDEKTNKQTDETLDTEKLADVTGGRNGFPEFPRVLDHPLTDESGDSDVSDRV